MSREVTMSETAAKQSKPDAPDAAARANVSIESVLGVREKSLFGLLLSSQAFWVTVALVLICVIMGFREPRFVSEDNFYNITRNFAFIGIMALGLTAVIITGGIDLSVGSIMGLAAVAAGLTLEAQYSWWLAILAALTAGLVAGLINGLKLAMKVPDGVA